jgi:hypothetical protein
MGGNFSEGDFLFRRLRALQEEAEYHAHRDRLWLGIPRVVGCINMLRSVGLKDKEIGCLLQHAADALARR